MIYDTSPIKVIEGLLSVTTPDLQADHLGTKIVVITGWSKNKELIESTLEEKDSQVACIGNLYSVNPGIDYLFRCLLANPQVNLVLALNSTSADKLYGPVECLSAIFSAFAAGSLSSEEEDFPVLVTTASNKQFSVNINLEKSIVLDLLKRISYLEFSNIGLLVDFVESVVKSGLSSTHAQANSKVLGLSNFYSLNFSSRKDSAPPALYFPIPKPEVKQGLNNIPAGYTIRAKTIAEAYPLILQRVRTYGSYLTNERGGTWQEIINLTTVIENEPKGLLFKPYLPDSAFIKEYFKQLWEVEPEIKSSGLSYTYGERIRRKVIAPQFYLDQVDFFVKRFLKNINTARAVINLWEDKCDPSSESPPCLNHIWARVRNGKLDLVATLRSNDMLSAFPSNAMGLRLAQEDLVEKLNKEDSNLNLALGSLIINSLSAHIYEQGWTTADNLISTHLLEPMSKHTRAFKQDLTGTYLISVDSSHTISVTHYNPITNSIVGYYEDKQPNRLIQQLIANNPELETTHAAYLGYELGRANQLGASYIQDN